MYKRSVLVMEILGQSLETLHANSSRKFSEKTVLMIADQLIERLESLHRHDYIHRDVKVISMILFDLILVPNSLVLGTKLIFFSLIIFWLVVWTIISYSWLIWVLQRSIEIILNMFHIVVTEWLELYATLQSIPIEKFNKVSDQQKTDPNPLNLQSSLTPIQILVA